METIDSVYVKVEGRFYGHSVKFQLVFTSFGEKIAADEATKWIEAAQKYNRGLTFKMSNEEDYGLPCLSGSRTDWYPPELADDLSKIGLIDW